MFLVAAAIALQSPTYRVLSTEARNDPSAASRVENVKGQAAPAYTGESPLPFHVEIVTPVELIDPVTGRRTTPGAETPVPPVPPPVTVRPPALAKPEAPAAEPETGGNPTYHFEGKKPFGGLTVYTPVRDQAGRDNSTRASGGGGGLMGLLKWIGLAVAVVVVLALLL